jgi:nucleoside-diphosphate-sugar epimerase
MARRPFDPQSLGLTKTEYRQGDVLDRGAIDALVAEADVVVHLAFVIVGGLEETRSVNLEGSRNVFAAAAAAPRAERLVYTSSVAAYGFHEDNPQPLTEDAPARGSDAHYYSAQKAELEAVLAKAIQGSGTEAYVFRPCIVAGPDAPTLIEGFTGQKVFGPRIRLLWRGLDAVPLVAPLLPDAGVPFQLVHHDDVAAAVRAAVLGRGEPGIYNLAGEGQVTVSDVAHALGWHSMRVPRTAVTAAAGVVSRIPLVPAEARWINAVRKPVLMDTSKARRRLRWRPRFDAHETLGETVVGARGAGIV